MIQASSQVNISAHVFLFQVYDRLNTLGVCLSYSRTLVLYKHVGEHFVDMLIRAAEQGKYIRFIGDNLNLILAVTAGVDSRP